MKKIFVDANILVDYLDKSAGDHRVAVECMLIIRKHFGKPVVSPASFIIINYLCQKTVKNKQWHRQQMQLIISGEINIVSFSCIKELFRTKKFIRNRPVRFTKYFSPTKEIFYPLIFAHGNKLHG